ncbi:hypothetical protein FA13DRAFT_1747320 [Coprinellus micaceus]|uniref:Fungal-type protein kinase domain-containing protein n=1 Tax=Coprinellus micaceus TaxID=71717 RepID=A0A4Y7S3S1_COPMI|nr:hypothetical protein FA13DRAFT_1747320 [Coprinellus micaceus]
MAASDHDSSCSCSTCSSGSFHYFDSNSKSTGKTKANILDNHEVDDEDLPETPVMKSMYARLEKEIGRCQHNNIQLLDFVHHVWGLDKSVGRQILSKPIPLDPYQLGMYTDGLRCGRFQDHFVVLADALVKAAVVELGDSNSDDVTTNVFWDAKARDKPIKHRDTDSNPVVFNLWKPTQPQELEPDWSVAKHIIEFKPVPDTKQTVQAGSSHPEPSIDAPKKGSTSTLKRSFDSVNDAGDEDGRAAKKARLIGDDIAPLKYSHLPSYASQALASTSRYWVTGLIFDSFKVTACYFDRFLVTSTTPFYFDENPERLALVLYAMAKCDRMHAGFDPRLHRQPYLSPQTTTGEPNCQQELPVKDIVGSFFQYPGSIDSVVSSQPALPVIFKVCEVIRRPYGLVGRGGAVYKVRLRLPSGALSEEALAYKLSWASKKRPSEIDIVRLLKERLPSESHVHFPDLIFTTSFTAEDLHLPWLRLGLNLTSDNHEERVQEGMLGRLYGKLWEVGSIENFKKVWLDCVECHFLALKMGKVLHRDLSENNLMIRVFGDGVVKGVLNDWDMAKLVGDQGKSLSESEQCTGTFPFMALDLLERETSPHWLRHDLESFFYILLWAAIHYNLAAKTRDEKVHPALEAWTTDLKSNTERKIQILSRRPIPVQMLYSCVKPEFADLVQEWIDPLRRLFMSAQDAYYITQEPSDSPLDEETYGGKLTFKTFMAAISVTPRTWGIPGFLDGED